MLGWFSAATALASRAKRESALVIGGQLRRQDLERHLAIERGVLGLIDHAHPAGADLAHDSVVAECLADHHDTAARYICAASLTCQWVVSKALVESSELTQDTNHTTVIVHSPAICCSQLSIWFHLARVWSTNLTSLRSFGWRPIPGPGLMRQTLRVCQLVRSRSGPPPSTR